MIIADRDEDLPTSAIIANAIADLDARLRGRSMTTREAIACMRVTQDWVVRLTTTLAENSAHVCVEEAKMSPQQETAHREQRAKLSAMFMSELLMDKQSVPMDGLGWNPEEMADRATQLADALMRRLA